MKKTIRVGTRDSRLALIQTNIVIDIIKKRHPELRFEILEMKTRGDLFQSEKIEAHSSRGFFVDDLEKALLRNDIDIAVHSMKDMTPILPDGLHIAAVSRREDPRDVLVTASGCMLKELRAGSIIGTSSLRREVQLKAIRPDLRVKDIRGNVDTRLKKMADGEFDGLILAAAGLIRSGYEKMCHEYFDADKFIPAIGQGILCVEARCGNDSSFLSDSVHDEDSSVILKAERAFMISLNGGCDTPVAAYAVINDNKLRLNGMYISGEGIIKRAIEGNRDDAQELGLRLAKIIKGGV